MTVNTPCIKKLENSTDEDDGVYIKEASTIKISAVWAAMWLVIIFCGCASFVIGITVTTKDTDSALLFGIMMVSIAVGCIQFSSNFGGSPCKQYIIYSIYNGRYHQDVTVDRTEDIEADEKAVCKTANALFEDIKGRLDKRNEEKARMEAIAKRCK